MATEIDRLRAEIERLTDEVAWLKTEMGEPVKWKDIRYAFSQLILGRRPDEFGCWSLHFVIKSGVHPLLEGVYCHHERRGEHHEPLAD